MLPKKHRLSKHAEVTKTTARGRSFFSPSFILKSLTLPNSELAQFTVIVSSKAVKTAVARNRLKRVIRQAIHPYIKQIKPGQYVIIIKQSATTITSKDLATEVIEALTKSKLLKV